MPCAALRTSPEKHMLRRVLANISSDYTMSAPDATSCVKSVNNHDSKTRVFSCSGETPIPTTIFFSDYPYLTIAWAQQIRIALPSANEPSSATVLSVPSSTSSPQNGGPISNGSSSNNNKKSGAGAGLIAGAVVGAVAGLALVGALIYLWRRKKLQSAASNRYQDALPEFMGTNAATNASLQMANAESEGLFQPQPIPGPKR